MALLLRRIKLSKSLNLSSSCGSIKNINSSLKRFSSNYVNLNQRGCLLNNIARLSTVRGSLSETLDSGKLLKNQDHQETPKKISKTDLKSLLGTAIENENITLTKAVTIINTLSKIAVQENINTSEIQSDARFQNLCHVFEKSCGSCSPMYLMTGLKGLLELKMDPNSKLVASIENELLWQSRKMNMRALSMFLAFHANYQETDIQKKVIREIVTLIQKRWIEINDTTTVLKILENNHLFTEEFLFKLEDRALDLTEKMSIEELHKLFTTLSFKKRRPTPLLRSISYHINQKPEKLTIKQSVDLLYALNALKFPDVTLVQRISNDLMPEINDTTKKNVITSILTCCGQLKWKHPGLLEACCMWIVNNSENCRPQEFVACLLTMANVNYIPEDADKLFDIIITKLEEKSLTSLIWLDVVWSLCILSRANENHVTSVLKPLFFESLLDSKVSKNPNVKFKLQNIYAVIKSEFQAIKIPENFLSKIEEPKTIVNDTSMKNGKNAVLDALNNLVPRGKFLATNLQSNFGFSIDAEFIINPDGKPIPIIDYGVRAGADYGIKPLPNKCQRIALLIWDFKDLTINATNLTGSSALAVRILEKHGYSVIEIFLQEFNANSTTVKKVQFLQQKIQEAKTLKKL